MFARLLTLVALLALAASPALAQKKVLGQNAGKPMAPQKVTKKPGAKKTPAGEKVTGAPIILNGATEAQLVTIKGIGPAKAKALVSHMKAKGPFKTWEDVAKVKGIGPATVQALKDGGVKLHKVAGRTAGPGKAPMGGLKAPMGKSGVTPATKKPATPSKAPGKKPMAPKKAPMKAPGIK
ncbi:MAG: helix-hairpin-helix domain-containing protein [Bradymonadia bacterium]